LFFTRIMNTDLFKNFQEYDKTKPQAIKEISGLLGIPINGRKSVEVPNRNGFVYVRLRNNTNELIQAFNEKVSPVYGLPVLVRWQTNRYEVVGRDTSRYSDWGSFSSFLPRHGSQHSLNFEDGQGGDVSFIYSRQFMPFATIPSGTEGAGTVFVMPHVYRSPDASWNYIGNESSPNFLPAKPTGTSARMMLLVWDLSTSDPLIITGTHLAESATGTASILPSVPVFTNQNYIPLAAIRLVSGTESVLWDNIYDMRQYAVTSPPSFAGGFGVWDEGIPQGTGTIFNFVGNNVEASVSGSVVRVFVTGSSGGGTIFAQDEGVPLGTPTTFNFTGDGVVATISGSVVRVDVSGGSISTGTLDARYLKLNTDNDPLTGQLRIIPTGTSKSGLYIESDGDDSPANFQQLPFANGNAVDPVLYLFRGPSGSNSPIFTAPLIQVQADNLPGTGGFSGGLLQYQINGSDILVDINPHVVGTGTATLFNTEYTLQPNGLLLLLENNDSPRFYVNASGTAYSNGQPLIKEAPLNSEIYGRKNNGWEIVIVPLMLSANGLNTTIPASTTDYLPPFSTTHSTTLINSLTTLAGTLKNFYVRIGTTQPASGSLVCTVFVNNVATALTITIAAGSVAGNYSDTTHTVAVSAGDRITFELKNNATGASATITPVVAELDVRAVS
jgi:hypothetical protein